MLDLRNLIVEETHRDGHIWTWYGNSRMDIIDVLEEIRYSIEEEGAIRFEFFYEEN